MKQKTLYDYGLTLQGQSTIWDWLDDGLYASQYPHTSEA